MAGVHAHAEAVRRAPQLAQLLLAGVQQAAAGYLKQVKTQRRSPAACGGKVRLPFVLPIGIVYSVFHAFTSKLYPCVSGEHLKEMLEEFIPVHIPGDLVRARGVFAEDGHAAEQAAVQHADEIVPFHGAQAFGDHVVPLVCG